MGNLKYQMKSAAAIAALAALGLVAVNYSSSEGSQLFLSERITEEEMMYMKYVTWGANPTEPRPSSSSEWRHSRRPSTRSHSTTPTTLTSPLLATTSSPTGLRLSTRDFSDTRASRPTTRKLRFSIPPTLLTPWTGDPEVLLPQLRTRDSAAHAGLSPPLVPLKDLFSSPPVLSNPSPSNSSLTALSRTTVATVVLWTMLSSTSSPTHSCLRMPTHTPPDRDIPANTFHPRVSVRLNPSRMSQETPLDNSSRLPLPRDQSLLPLRLTNSHSRATLAVLSPPDAEPNSTTVSLPLDTVPLTVPITSSSRTLWEPHGETRVTLESPQTSAVSPSSHHTPPAERFEQINDS